MPALTLETLRRQDDQTSNAVLSILSHDAHFARLATSEGNDIVRRDQEDDTKLSVGIKIAVAKGVLEANPAVAPVTKISVVGKTADEVANEVLSRLPSKDGNVLVLQGLSGTGKGTTVAKLQQALPNCVCWSNGNVFRSFTHLASLHCDASGTPWNAAEVLTPANLAAWSARLSFEKFADGFDVVIAGVGRVSTIVNTELKKPHISQRVPTVAEQTQGEVVKFAAGAVATLQAAGCNVILEGRAQTLNYIPTPLRFELVIEDPALLGQRRAAQRVMAAAIAAIEANPGADPTLTVKIVASQLAGA